MLAVKDIIIRKSIDPLHNTSNMTTYIVARHSVLVKMLGNELDKVRIQGGFIVIIRIQINNTTI